jgi:predicted component of type VI protein secretion system
MTGSQQVPMAGFPSAPPQPIPAPTTGPRLYIMSGPRAGETLGLRHGFMIGAAPTNDLVIADGFASGQHAQIGMDAQGNCWIADLGSTNGTFMNGVRITTKGLDHGVTVKIGSTEIRFLAQ